MPGAVLGVDVGGTTTAAGLVTTRGHAQGLPTSDVGDAAVLGDAEDDGTDGRGRF